MAMTCTVDEFASLAEEVLDKLGAPLAVRSSGVKEDSASKAFAGIFETCLGVKSTADLIRAFAKVKGSGVTKTVEDYCGETISQDYILEVQTSLG